MIGAKQVLKDFEALTRTLKGLMRKHRKSDMKALQKAFKPVRTQVTAKVYFRLRRKSLLCKMRTLEERICARLAQLVERRHDMADVVGSSPTVSTTFSRLHLSKEHPKTTLLSSTLFPTMKP